MAVFSYMSFSESTMRHPAQQAQDEHKAMTFLSFLLAEEKKKAAVIPSSFRYCRWVSVLGRQQRCQSLGSEQRFLCHKYL